MKKICPTFLFLSFICCNCFALQNEQISQLLGIGFDIRNKPRKIVYSDNEYVNFEYTTDKVKIERIIFTQDYKETIPSCEPIKQNMEIELDNTYITISVLNGGNVDSVKIIELNDEKKLVKIKEFDTSFYSESIFTYKQDTIFIAHESKSFYRDSTKKTELKIEKNKLLLNDRKIEIIEDSQGRTHTVLIDGIAKQKYIY